jgi:hypothetical protein
MLNRASASPACSTASCASGFVGARLPANQRQPDRARDCLSRSRCHCAWSSLHFPTRRLQQCCPNTVASGDCSPRSNPPWIPATTVTGLRRHMQTTNMCPTLRHRSSNSSKQTATSTPDMPRNTRPRSRRCIRAMRNHRPSKTTHKWPSLAHRASTIRRRPRHTPSSSRHERSHRS